MEATQMIRKILTTSTFDVFEKMFFIFLEMSATGKPQYDLVTSIRFSGPFDGEIRLGFSDSLVLAMVENMLSVDQNNFAACLARAMARISDTTATAVGCPPAPWPPNTVSPP